MAAEELKEVARALAGPLEAEARNGYRDQAVIGQSIAEYARAWGERARRAAAGDGAQALCQRITQTLQDYGRCRAEGRRERAEEAQRLLERLAETPGGPSREAPERPPDPHGAGLDQRLSEGPFRRFAWVKRLGKLGIITNRDLLYHFPRDYAPLRRIRELRDGEHAAVAVAAGAREEAIIREERRARLVRYSLRVSDESGRAWVTSFARVPRHGGRAKAIAEGPLSLNYPEGTALLVEGRVRRSGGFIEIQYAGSERLSGGRAPEAGALVPVYPLTDGVHQGQVRRAVERLLDALADDLADPLPESMRRRYGLPGLRQALRDIHWPASEAAMEAARRRLAFEEFVVLQVALAQQKRERQRPGTGICMAPRGDMVAVLEEILPFPLTRAQQRVIAEITGDMAADVPMCRLLQGDVGSGKTVVAAAALLVALQNAYQGALMAPTELLAEQHYLVLSRMLEPLGVKIELLTGSVRGAERERAYERIARGQAQVVVGTHALIQEGVDFHRLGIVIIDEQHRFGVRQRADLLAKGARPDLLVMTATPIPRTLALTAYGDLDMSILDEMPPGRRPVRTIWRPIQAQSEAYEFVRQQVAEGRQAYVVCPLIEESENLQAEAATKLAAELQEKVFPELRVGLLHGGMRVGEKDEVMQRFRRGEIDVLCATTVVEVGVDVPNATVMVVLNAERYGLAQLHQLRGRVGRGGHESFCILLSDRGHDPGAWAGAEAEDAAAQGRRRMRVMIEESDGFRIAEADLELRGPGEFYGTRQHGLPDFRLARMVRDVGLLEEAREAAAWLVERDPMLEAPEHAGLREQVRMLRERMESAAA